MLISVFSIWLSVSNIQFLRPYPGGCSIVYNQSVITMEHKSCSDIANEINKQVNK